MIQSVSVILSLSNITPKELVIAFVGYLIVFAALLLLYLIFNYLPRLMYMKLHRNKKENDEGEEQKDRMISGEEIAAVSMAMHYILSELHDEESGVLTIKKVSKTYSPWSSKIYAVRNQFNRI